MANHKSAIKRHKQSLQRAERNRAMRSRVRGAIKKVRLAIAENNAEAANAELRKATSVIDHAASKGTVHWRNASRKISRLASAVNGIAA